ncbi:hypothetical protein L1049_007995 [Liquidambar formosana]|uniref:Disease resistance protein winged helix domain-containing protein n=1 Tax=Liquidambar formosana TaxID=63359 RepID=A0AAP0S901_LIQFO
MKCPGIPLAVRTLGCLLYMKTEEYEWLYIRDNDIWKLGQKENDILPALMLSYQPFPSYLKQCFAYCSIFPKDYEIQRETMINYWMAQGLLQSPNKSRQYEDIGNRYFDELMSISFFEDVNSYLDNEIHSCKIHDLVLDLAQQVTGTEWLNVDSNSQINP